MAFVSTFHLTRTALSKSLKQSYSALVGSVHTHSTATILSHARSTSRVVDVLIYRKGNLSPGEICSGIGQRKLSCACTIPITDLRSDCWHYGYSNTFFWPTHNRQSIRHFRIQHSYAESPKYGKSSFSNSKAKGGKYVKRRKENIKTIPNLLTSLRMASSPVLAYLVVNEQFGFALSMFVVAGITDMLDGYIARNFKNQKSAFGAALDPFADKLLMSFLTLSLTSVGLMPVPLTVLILGRDAGLILGGFYVRWISLSPPKTIKRYFDGSHVTVKFYPSQISKWNTGVQFAFVAMALASPVFDFVGHPLMTLFMYTTATTTFLSGADYLISWRKRLKIVKND